MSSNTQQFMVSVADCWLRDTVADSIVLRGKALINSAFKVSLSSQEIRGGFGNTLLYTYNHSRKVDLTIESATFDEGYMAANSGTLIGNSAQNVFFEEIITLSSGAGATTNTPVGNVYVQPVSTGGSITTITPTGKNFTVSGGANNQYRVMYRYSNVVDNFTIDASLVPNTYELTMQIPIFQATGKTATLEITVSNYKLSGNFDLNFSAAGVSSSKLDGYALVNASDNSYAYVRMIPATATTASYIALAANPGSVSLSSTTTTSQLTVYALRGGLYAPVNVTSANGITYTSSDATKVTVSTGGLLTRVAAGSASITISYSGLTDQVPVTIT
jgi:hypothetical protein